MKNLPLQFRCYAKLDHEVGQWVAVCVDLGLAAQGDTLKEAQDGLHSQVKDYLQDVIELSATDRRAADAMLNRKAPLSQLAFYHYLRFCGKFLPKRSVQVATRFKDNQTPAFA